MTVAAAAQTIMTPRRRPQCALARSCTHTSKAASPIRRPAAGRYAYLSDVATMLKPTTPVVGSNARRKKVQDAIGAAVHRHAMIRTNTNTSAAAALAATAGLDRLIGCGRG